VVIHLLIPCDSVLIAIFTFTTYFAEWCILKWQARYVTCCYLLSVRVPHVMSSLVALTLLSVLPFLKTYDPVTCRMQCICLPAICQRLQLNSTICHLLSLCAFLYWSCLLKSEILNVIVVTCSVVLHVYQLN